MLPYILVTRGEQQYKSGEHEQGEITHLHRQVKLLLSEIEEQIVLRHEASVMST